MEKGVAMAEEKVEEITLLNQVQQELAYYFGQWHANSKHTAQAMKCNYPECKRIKELIFTEADTANTRQRAERAARAWLNKTGLLNTDDFDLGVRQLTDIIAAEFEK